MTSTDENSFLLRPSKVSTTPKFEIFTIYSITFGTMNELSIFSGALLTIFSL